MRKVFFAVMAVAAIMLTSCHKNIMYISGTIIVANYCYLLYLTCYMRFGQPIDSAIVEDSKFEFVGVKDTLMLCMIYKQDGPMVGRIFVEKGVATMVRDFNENTLKIGGTPANDKWQQLNDEMTSCGDDDAKAIKAIENHVKENIATEYGYIAFSQYYSAMDASTRISIIEMMPADMQSREQTQAILKGAQEEMKVSAGTKAPDFVMNDIKGNETSLYKEMEGKKIVIIDFWASWCPPCRAEMPHLVELYAKYAAKGLGIVGISLDNKMEAWEKETATQGITWNQLSDLQGWNNAAAKLYAVKSIPQMFVVDSEGTIIARGLRGKALEELISEKLD